MGIRSKKNTKMVKKYTTKIVMGLLQAKDQRKDLVLVRRLLLMELIMNLNKDEMKTIAEQLNIKEFPFIIKNKNGNEIYYENSKGFWSRREWKDGNTIYYESSNGLIIDNRPKKLIMDLNIDERPCVGKKVTIDGVDYELK